jgi:hypothetical protein
MLGNGGETPFANLSAEDVASVEITLMPGSSKLFEDEATIEEIVDILQRIKVNERGEPLESLGFNGQSVYYTLLMEDGEKHVISSFAGYIGIDGVSYHSDSRSADAMSSFANNALMTGFADIVFEPGDRLFDILLIDDVQGVMFGNRFGETYLLDDPTELVAFVGLLEDIVIEERYEMGTKPVGDIVG